MSALSVPTNPLLAQPKTPTPGGNNSAEAPATPFSSVLQQKVQSGKKDGASKPVDTSNAANNTATPVSPPTTDKAAAPAEAPDAAAIANGDYAQSALAQLLPWLQGMQGQEQAAATEITAETVLPQAETLLPQIALPAMQIDPKLSLKQDDKAETAELPVIQTEGDADAFKLAANLAAPTETLVQGDKNKGAHESFDAALDGVHERLDAQANQNTANTARSSSEPTRLQSPLGTSQWQTEFTDRVQLMSRNNESRAELVLTPAQLGRIEITLNINGDQANAMFVSANPEVRTALEGAMDRLREALANNGISLGQTHVGSESSSQSDSGFAGNRQGGESGNSAQEVATSTAWTRHSNNMLDVFA